MKRFIIAFTTLALLGTGSALAAPRHHDRQGPAVRHVEKHVVVKKKVVKRTKWSRGHTLPRAYRSRFIAERDYGRYHLRRPPHGQRWVRVDNDFILISAATGVIASIIAAQ